MGDACFTAKAEAVLTATGKRGSRGGEREYEATAFKTEYIAECFHGVNVAGMIDRHDAYRSKNGKAPTPSTCSIHEGGSSGI